MKFYITIFLLCFYSFVSSQDNNWDNIYAVVNFVNEDNNINNKSNNDSSSILVIKDMLIKKTSIDNYVLLENSKNNLINLNIQNSSKISKIILEDKILLFNEEVSEVVSGNIVFDLNLNYNLKRFNFSLIVENLIKSKNNNTQLETDAAMQKEFQTIEQIHFTPGTPFFAKLKIGYNF
jgi:hypothetical protein